MQSDSGFVWPNGKGESAMKKLLAVAVSILFLFGMIPATIYSPITANAAEDNIKTAVNVISKTHRVGFDWEGEALKDGVSVPWQRPGQVIWGRTGFYMPNALKSVDSNSGLAKACTDSKDQVNPVFYGQVYLDIIARGPISNEARPYYFVIDDSGQIWFDSDGYFNDARYNPRADPLVAKYPFEEFPLNGNYYPGSCDTNPRALVDSSAENNTKGPFVINKNRKDYIENVYFWDYKKDEDSEATDRLWQLGWGDLIDYKFEGAPLPGGQTETGIVNYDTSLPDGDPAGDWDFGLPLVPFFQENFENPSTLLFDEFHVELVQDGRYTPGKMTSNTQEKRPPEFIYKKSTPIEWIYSSPMPTSKVEIDDLRLSPVTIKRIIAHEYEIKNYGAGTKVVDGDWDLDIDLISFANNEQFVDSVIENTQYEAGEWIYRLPNAPIVGPRDNPILNPLTVPAEAIRVTNVNNRKYATSVRLYPYLGCGISDGDALIMLEVFEGGCHTDNYDISVLSDIYMGNNPSFAAAKLFSANGDIKGETQRIQKNTVLDPALDEDKYHLLPGTTYHDIQFQYREYIGVELFSDNGIDNSVNYSLPEDYLREQDLSDNYRESRTCEEFLGAKNYLGVLDSGRRLEKIPANFKFHDTIQNPIPGYQPLFGCGESVYYLSDPGRTDNDVVIPGDKRFTDMDVTVGQTKISYRRNTVVVAGDADEGLSLDSFYQPGEPQYYKFFTPDYNNHIEQPSNPFDYDPILTKVYYDTNENFIVDPGDTRYSDIEIEGVEYSCGTVVKSGDAYFMQTTVHMITVGKNGNNRCMDENVLPGDIGLQVKVDGEGLRVEKTSTIEVTVDPPPVKDEKVYVTLQEPEANEFNVFRYNQTVVDHTYPEIDYNVNGAPMHWYGDGGGSSGSWLYQLPFQFPLAGQFYNRVYVSEKGFLNFSSSYSMPLPLNDQDVRLSVYGDDLSILPPGDPMNITTQPGFDALPLKNVDKEDIYISVTSDSVTFRWRAQTRYTTNQGAIVPNIDDTGAYPAPNGNQYYLIDAQATLFSDGTIVLNYLKDLVDPNQTEWDSYYEKMHNRVNNVRRRTWVLGSPVVGIALDGSGLASPYNGLKNMAYVDGYTNVANPIPSTWPYPPRMDTYAADKWNMEVRAFNQPTIFGGNYPRYDEWKPYVDYRVLTKEHPTATFEYTPYRGTCRETGIPDALEIRAYKDLGGRKIAPKDSKYTYFQQDNYSDPTVWNSKWTKTEYWNKAWGIYQKTKYFVYPPTKELFEDSSSRSGTNLIPDTLNDVYDCFGLERLQIAPADIEIIPNKDCINPLDERQPMLKLNLFAHNDKDDVNDPQGMAMSSFRKTIDVSSGGIATTLDFALTTNWQPRIPTAPFGAFYLTLSAGMENLFEVGDMVYIPPSTSPGKPQYRRIVRIDYATHRIWFDLAIEAPVPSGFQVVPNPIVGNYNVEGGGILGMFTTIGSAGQKYIVQVRADGSYDYWRWYEPINIGQVVGALDACDVLYSIQHQPMYQRSDQGCVGPPCQNHHTPFPMPNSRPTLGLIDRDCSIGDTICSLPGIDNPNFPKMGEWSINDAYGIFNGGNVDSHWVYPSNGCYNPPQTWGSLSTWGVPVLIQPNKKPVRIQDLYDDGGQCIIATWPQDPSTPVNIRVYLNTCIFDYNSVYEHPPYFMMDTGMGIDYSGTVQVKLSRPNPNMNVTDLTVLDHALQSSKVSYTLGDAAISPLPPPSPQIAARYNPILENLNRDLRSYPGGQSNTGRVEADILPRDNSYGSNWNAYPAIWKDKYSKLGTEFMPLTDYGLAFYLKTTNPYDHVSFFAYPAEQRIIRMVIEGPFAFPKTVMEDNMRGAAGQSDQYVFRLNQRYEYKQYKNVPIDYDFSQKLVIDYGNYFKYEMLGGAFGTRNDSYTGFAVPTGNHDFARVTNPGALFDSIVIPDNEMNPWLKTNQEWLYWGAGRYGWPTQYTCANPYRNAAHWFYNPVFLIDELIPIGNGEINITVTLGNGIEVSFKDCCQDPPMNSIPVHGISIEDSPVELEIEEDHEIELTLTEASIPEQDTEYCNNALLVAWQDRGVIDKYTKEIYGMGDGQLANPPRSSNWFNKGVQFPDKMDLNLDGKISFEDYETEIMGTYDMSTNTWTTGIIDGRTFHREDGLYALSLTKQNGAQIETIGYDFGGIPDASGEFDKKPDHIISEYEIIPIYINAYKYGDDNTDRAFTPLWKPFSPNEYSHEVYLSGMARIEPVPHNDLVISFGPDPITSGVTPELVNPDKPLTFTVLDEVGEPLDLSIGVPDSKNQTKILDRNIRNVLFQDPHPDNKRFFGQEASIPRYYWLRTDLHNNDGTVYDNESIYLSSMTPFDPIDIDFSRADTGTYKFYNFCANDSGSFPVYVFTPDRRHYGETVVNVKLPSIVYSFSNIEDTTETEYFVPGSPDFTMTSMDKRIYKVSLQVFDAQGEVLKGTDGANVCEGTDDARVTITNTFLRNFRYRFANMPRYYNLLGIDKNQNGKIDILNRERMNVAGFRSPSLEDLPSNAFLYNTGSVLDSEGRFSTVPLYDIPPENLQFSGWGLGNIYNSMYYGGYCFPDIDDDGVLTFNDSISLDQEGKASFLYYANDMGLSESYFGAFVGKNRLTSNPSWADVAGYPHFDNYGPNDVYRRFRWGGMRFRNSHSYDRNAMFRIDWDSHPDTFSMIKGPEFIFLNAETREPLGKELLSPAYYDLVFGVENNFIVQAIQADSRDLPIKEGGSIVLSGYGAVDSIGDEREIKGKMSYGSDEGVPETVISCTPAGAGQSLGYIRYILPNGGYGEYEMHDVGINEYGRFDVANGLGVKVLAMTSLKVNQEVQIQILTTDAGSGKPIQGASVRLTGAGISERTKSDQNGICDVTFTPTREGLIEIHAEKAGMVSGKNEIFVSSNETVYSILDTNKFSVNIDNVIIKKGSLYITGSLRNVDGMYVGGLPAEISNEEWLLNIPFEYGKNSVDVVVYDLDGNVENIVLNIEVNGDIAVFGNTYSDIVNKVYCKENNDFKVYRNESDGSFCVVKLV